MRIATPANNPIIIANVFSPSLSDLPAKYELPIEQSKLSTKEKESVPFFLLIKTKNCFFDTNLF